MRKIDLLYGFLIGMAATFAGTYIFIAAFTDYTFAEGLTKLKEEDYLGKLITLGAVLNLAAFFLLLKFKKELMARGVILATIIMAIVSLFV